MSLINEALRKAQNQRQQAPGLGDDTNLGNQPINYAPQPGRLGLMIGLSLFIIILVGLVAGLTLVIMSKDLSQSAQQPALSQSENTAPPETSVLETASIDQTTNSASDPRVELKEAAPLDSEPPATEALKQPIEITRKPIAKPEPNPEITAWLEQSTISGVRITSSSSKVILNNKAYMPDEIVNMALELKILEIEPERIRFIDANGAEYIKSF